MEEPVGLTASYRRDETNQIREALIAALGTLQALPESPHLSSVIAKCETALDLIHKGEEQGLDDVLSTYDRRGA
jgi:hypothetical protein